jgi:signal transduction histidine kinase
MLELAQVGAGWPLAASLAAVVTARGLWAGRRRAALNEALHEVRRPLQALALAGPGTTGRRAAVGVEGPLQLAAVALERLDREINGEAIERPRMRFPAERLLDAAVARWTERAALAGASLELRWSAGSAAIECDRCRLAQAFDNLIVNAIEHGGSEIQVEARVRGRWLRVAVIDSGPARRAGPDGGGKGGILTRLRGCRRRGHGLRVVHRAAAEHAGEFRFRRTELGAEAVLELPLAGAEGVGVG